jgi:hypothetical protein
MDKIHSCPNGHPEKHFAYFYPKPNKDGKKSYPIIYCIKCKKFLYEIESNKSVSKLDARLVV